MGTLMGNRSLKGTQPKKKSMGGQPKKQNWLPKEQITKKVLNTDPFVDWGSIDKCLAQWLLEHNGSIRKMFGKD